jgi:hypothetical protein
MQERVAGLYSLKSITCPASGPYGPSGDYQLTRKDYRSMWIARIATTTSRISLKGSRFF